MTDQDLDPPEHTCGEEPVTPQKWNFWFLPGMMCNLFANLIRACHTAIAGLVQFFEEIGHGCYAHGLYKQQASVNEDTVGTFQKQLTRL